MRSQIEARLDPVRERVKEAGRVLRPAERTDGKRSVETADWIQKTIAGTAMDYEFA